MSPDRHALIKEVFLAAAACSPNDRPRLLDERCGEDRKLRDEVERLLAHHVSGTISPANGADDERGAAGRLRFAGPTDRTTAPVPPAPPTIPPRTLRTLEPGTVLADRYRIVAPLGHGGMGEVYRAEDLKLGQTIALKFLRVSFASDPAWLARFVGEARVARSVTHPNVCRVFDIGEADGEHFLTMEYIDGEDLATLLRRIGRLPADKALDTARQLCVGLAAAHGAGVLHRDLKPANIMLDGRGRVRITDFGLAGLAHEIEGRELRAGTPAYMAPEQIAGESVSVRSDLYSLGLVLYELVTGRPAFEAERLSEYLDLHRSSTPKPPSQLVGDIPPEFERVILRCLDKDPQCRPESALAVAAALPGGDLLEAAMAAGQTPSPEMVAKATPRTPVVSSPLMLLVLSAAALVALVYVRAAAPAPWDQVSSKSPDVLVEWAQDLLRSAGYAVDGVDYACGFCRAAEAGSLAFGYSDATAAAWPLGNSSEGGLFFWYRQSGGLLVPSEARNVVFGAAQVTTRDPLPVTAGMASMAFNDRGRLLLFAAVPEPRENRSPDPSRPAPTMRWEPFFERAGLNTSALVSVEPSITALFATDAAFAWQLESAGTDGVRVDALATGGRPVLFTVRRSTEAPLSSAGPTPQLRQVVVETSA